MSVLDAATASVLLLLAIGVFVTAPAAAANRAFAALLTLWAGHAGTQGLLAAAASRDAALFWAHVNAWYFLPLFALVVTFVTFFPATRHARAWRLGVLGAALALAGVTLAAFAFDHALVVAAVVQLPSGAWAVERGPVYYANNALALVALALAVVTLTRDFTLRTTDSILRRQCLPVVAAFATTLAHSAFFFVAYALADPRSLTANGPWFPLVPAAAVLGAGAVAFALRRLAAAPDARVLSRLPALAALAAVADVALFTGARFGLPTIPGYTTSRHVWLLAFAGLVAFALVRYEFLGFGARARRRVTLATGAVGGAGVVIGTSALVLLVFGVTPLTVGAAQVAALGALAAAFMPLRRFASGLAARLVPVPEGGVPERGLEVYRAALERAFESDGTLSSTSETMLKELRRELGLTDRDHALLVATVRPRTVSGHARARGFTPGALLLSRYRVERELGAGATARVLLCRDEVVGRACVVKVLHPDRAHDADAPARVLKEARALGAVRSPHVVTLYDAERVGDDVHLVLEHVPGGTLENALATRGGLPVPEAVRVTRDVLAGLAAMHAAGVVHRDVKPQNVLLHADGRAVLADFGAARIEEAALHASGGFTFGALTATGFQPGTLVTMSPEQARGVPVDARADVYAAGAVLYRVLTGEHYVDFEGLTEFEVREAILLEPPRLPHPRVPAPLEAVVRKALAKRPEERYASAEAFLRALEEAAPGLREKATA